MTTKRAREDGDALDTDTDALDPFEAIAQKWGGFVEAVFDCSDDDPAERARVATATVPFQTVIEPLERFQKVTEVAQFAHTLHNAERKDDSHKPVAALNSPLLDELVGAVAGVAVNKRDSTFVNQYLFALSRNGAIRAWKFLMALPFPPQFPFKANNISHCIEVATRHGKIELMQYLVQVFPQYRWRLAIQEQIPMWKQDDAFLAYYALRDPDLPIGENDTGHLIRQCAIHRCMQSLHHLLQDLPNRSEFDPDFLVCWQSLFDVEGDVRPLQAFYDHGVHLIQGSYKQAIESEQLVYVKWFAEHYPLTDPWSLTRGLNYGFFWRFASQAPVLDYLLTERRPANLATSWELGALFRALLSHASDGILAEVCRKHLDYLPNSISLHSLHAVPPEFAKAVTDSIRGKRYGKLKWLISDVGVPMHKMDAKITGTLMFTADYTALDLVLQLGFIIPQNLLEAVRYFFDGELHHHGFFLIKTEKVEFLKRLFELGADPSSLNGAFYDARDCKLDYRMRFLFQAGVPAAVFQVPLLIAEGKMKPEP